MYVVQLLLPKADNQNHTFPTALTEAIELELTDRFGGVTAYSRSPARGIWKDDGANKLDDIIVVEVMATTVDVRWWGKFRVRLEQELGQEQIIIRAQKAVQL